MPVYPGLIRVGMALTGDTSPQGFAAVAVTISVAASAVAALLFFRLCRRWLSEGTALLATALLCVAPLSPIVQVGYAESLHLALLFGALILVLDRRWVLLPVVVTVMALTRPSGLAFALLLALTRHIVDAAERTRRGDFSQAGLRGMDLAGKTLGVIGAGRIGRRAITIGRGFGMEVLACDLRPDPSVAQALGFRYADLDEVLRGADVLTLHVPGGVGSSHLISDNEFAAMRPGALLVNTARGGVIDPEALVRALAAGKIGGAALDVLPEESVIGDEAEIFRTGHPPVDPGSLRTILADHALLRFPNVIVTPHIAYDTREALERIVATTVANIEAFARGAPGNLVS